MSRKWCKQNEQGCKVVGQNKFPTQGQEITKEDEKQEANWLGDIHASNFKQYQIESFPSSKTNQYIDGKRTRYSIP